MPSVFRSLLASACSGTPLSAADAKKLLPHLPSRLLDLTGAAGAASRAATLAGKARPFACGIINAKSGRCTEDCAFCAQSRHHETGAAVYPLLGGEALLERAERLAEAGVAYMGIVTSGAGPSGRDLDALCEAASRITARAGIKLCASLGLLKEGQAEALRQAGFTSYHHNLETSRSRYPSICTTHGYEKRVETVRRAKTAGLRVCSGGIFGLGEGWTERLELSETLRELGVDSIPVNFLTPIPGTAMENAPGLEPQEALAVIALFRLMHPARDLIICGGRGSTLGAWENSVFFAGANAIMVGDYLTAKGSPFERDRDLLRALGIMPPA